MKKGQKKSRLSASLAEALSSGAQLPPAKVEDEQEEDTTTTVQTEKTGGEGGDGNISGDVTATQHGQIMVEGQFAYGLLAQSIAGGGGAGGLNISAAVTGAGNAARKTEGIAIAAGVGGNGGTGADAGDVNLTSDGNVFVNTIITEVDGFAEFEDLVEGQSVAETQDESTGITKRVVTDWRTSSRAADLRPLHDDDAGRVMITRLMISRGR